MALLAAMVLVGINETGHMRSQDAVEQLAQGLTTRKVNPSILLVVSLFSPDGSYDDLFLNNFWSGFSFFEDAKI